MGPKTHVLARFIVFRCIWDCFITAVKLGAKQAELVQLVQKFVPRSHVSEFFAMSTPDPTHRTLNLCFGMFHSVRVNLGLFCYGSKLGAKRAELVQLMKKLMP